MKKLTKEQKETLQKLRTYYCKEFSEDPVDGSNFDNAVLDLLGNHFVEEWMNVCPNRDEIIKSE
jgi:hypothetical protein